MKCIKCTPERHQNFTHIYKVDYVHYNVQFMTLYQKRSSNPLKNEFIFSSRDSFQLLVHSIFLLLLLNHSILRGFHFDVILSIIVGGVVSILVHWFDTFNISSPQLLTNTGVQEESSEEVFDGVANVTMSLPDCGAHYANDTRKGEVTHPSQSPQIASSQMEKVEEDKSQQQPVTHNRKHVHHVLPEVPHFACRLGRPERPQQPGEKPLQNDIGFELGCEVQIPH